MPFAPFDRQFLRKAGSHAAMAIALAMGAAVATAGFAEPAFAQKKKDKKDEAKAQYSTEFVTAYKPIEEGKIGRASCRERVCQYVLISVVAVALTKHT